MASKLDFLIDVNDAAIPKASNSIKGLGAQVASTSKLVEAAGVGVSNASKKINNGILGTAGAGKNFSNMSKGVVRDSSSIVQAWAVLGSNIFSITAAFTALRDAAKADLLFKGLEAQSARLGISLKNTSRQLQEVTRYAISATEAAEATALVASAGFTSKDAINLTKAATNSSIALGRNMTDALDRMIKGVVKLEPELLDELGIMVKLNEATSAYGQKLGKSALALTSFERRQAFLNAVMEESEAKFGTVADAVDTNKYDKLAAAFDNLSKGGLKLINTVLDPLIGILAASPLALFGVLAAFGGSLAKSVAPSMFQISEQLNDQLETNKRIIESKTAQIAVIDKQIAAEMRLARASAITPLTGALKDARGADGKRVKEPANVKDFLNKVALGKATELDRTAALKAAKAKRDFYQRSAVNVDADGVPLDAFKRRIKGTDEEVAAIRAANTRLAKSYATVASEIAAVSLTDTKFVSIAKKNSEARTAAILQTSIARQRDERITATAASYDILAHEGVRAALQNTQVATNLYRKELETSQLVLNANAAAGGLVATRTAAIAQSTMNARIAMFQFALSAKVAGAALLNALPVIGQIIFAFGLIYEAGKAAWNFFVPGQKALDEANASLKEVIKTAESAAKTTSKVFSNPGSGASSLASATITVANSVAELADAYRVAAEARDKLYAKKENKIELVDKLATSDINSIYGGYTDGFVDTGDNSKKNLVEKSKEFEIIQKMANLGYPKLVEEIRAYTSVSNKAWQDSNAAEQIERLGELIPKLAEKYQGLGASTTEFTNSYKKLEESSQNFIKAAGATTPYDTLVSSLSASKVSLLEMTAEVAEGSRGIEEFNTLVGSIGQSSSSLLGNSLQKDKQDLLEINAYLKQLQELKARGVNVDQALNTVGAQRAVVQERIAAGTVAGLDAALKTTINLQRQTVLAASLAETEKIRADKADKFGKDTGAAILARAASENRILALKVQQINAEAGLLKLSLETQNATRAQLQARVDLLKSQQTNLEVLAEENKLKSEGLEIAKQSLQVQRISSFLSNLTGLGKKEKEEAQARQAELARLESQLVAADAETRTLTNSIDALNAQARNAAASMTNMADAAGEATRADFAIRLRLLSEVYEYEAQINNLKAKSAIRVGSSAITAYEREVKLVKLNRDSAVAEARRTKNAEIAAIEADIRQAASYSVQNAQTIQHVKNLKAQLAILQKQANLQESIIRAQSYMEIIEKARIDIYSEGISIQKTQLELLQEQRSVTQDLVNKQSQLYEAKLKNAAVRRTGSSELDSTTLRNLEIKAAGESLRVAKQEFGLKLEIIKAEYALLDAKKLADITEYRLKAATLRRTGSSSDTLAAQQLETAANALNSIDFSSIVQAKSKSALEAIRIQEIELDTLQRTRLTESLSPFGAMFSNLANIIETEGKSRLASRLGFSETTAETPAPTVIIPSMDQAVLTSTRIIDEFGSTLDSLVTNFAGLNAQITEYRTLATTTAQQYRTPTTGQATLASSISEEVAYMAATAVAEAGSNFLDQKKVIDVIVNRAASNFGGRNTVKGVVTARAQFSPWNGEGSKRQLKLVEAAMTGNYNLLRGTGVSIEAFKEAIKNSTRAIEGERGASGGALYFQNNSISDAPGRRRLAAAKAANGLTGSSSNGHEYFSENAGQAARTKARGASFRFNNAAISAVSNNSVVTTNAPIEALTTSVRSVNDAIDIIPKTVSEIVNFKAKTASEENTTATDHVIVTATRQSNAIVGTFAQYNSVLQFHANRMEELGDAMGSMGPAIAKSTRLFLSLGESLSMATSNRGGGGLKGILTDFFKNPPSVITGGYLKTIKSLETYLKDQGIDTTDTNSEAYKVASAQYTKQTDRIGNVTGKAVTTTQVDGGRALSSTEQFALKAATAHEKLNTVATAYAGISQSIMAITEASTSAKINAIDSEIAAEQKRDGKSKESVEKIRALEAKKDALARKQFNLNKKMQMASAVINTATAITGALALLPNPAAFVIAGIAAAMGATQLALIGSTQFQSSTTSAASTTSTPSTISVGKQSDKVDLAKGPNSSAGGESGYIRGSQGQGSSAANYRTIGSAYGGNPLRGYGNRGMVVGEKGPETINVDELGLKVRANSVDSQTSTASPMNLSFNISAIDAKGVKEMLDSNKGSIIEMIRKAANASGEDFLEVVNTNSLNKSRGNVGKM